MFSFCFVLSKTKNYEKDFLATHNACKSALLRLSSNSSMGECVCFMCVFLFVRARMIKKKNTKAEVYFFKVLRMHSTNANSDLSYPILLNTRSRKKKSLKIFFRNFGKKSEREQYYDASVARTLFFHNLNQVCTMHIRNTKYMRPCTYALCAMNVARPPMLRLHNVHAYCC